jgi:ankyrin repeat protein
VQILLKDKRVDPSDEDNSSIKLACTFGHYDVAKALLSDPRVCSIFQIIDYNKPKEPNYTFHYSHIKVDPSSEGDFALRRSAENGYHKIIKILLKDPRVDASISDDYALKRACRNGHVEVVRVLLTDKRVNPSASMRIVKL